MCMHALPACISVYHEYTWYPLKARKRTLYNTDVTNGCVPPCGCWKLNLSPLQEDTVLLASELSL